ncbi:hypothetical protein HH310_24925 [Actinoplanes sp. TBRC 11911]|uniref:hypothetical protein n=1 Tax=Actinoplanes sp. TBRC 11911 TaxID=2729386 RepID=UPI00145F42EE|nr:hypothetical protein [Actinoplanes sp. TBRC 11911]NMO54414.1 hypothetical protein [Actinoplanes sp. TBRC 11911]
MTTQGVQPTMDELQARAIARLQYALSCSYERAASIITRDLDRWKEIAEFVRRDQEENADFYRELGDR